MKQAIEAAKIASDNAVFIQAVVCYGDLLSETGRARTCRRMAEAGPRRSCLYEFGYGCAGF
ncbi:MULTISPECIES: hypothetical protein [unclassified Paenibacillus]|uniref:hypothetical protein n=1 Tax=unclassified Paenibacillus TaxID=185978 RepID=UPI003692F45C